MFVTKPSSRVASRTATGSENQLIVTISRYYWPLLGQHCLRVTGLAHANFEAELVDFAGSKFFAILDLRHAFWQLLLYKISHGTCGTISPEEVDVPTRVLHGLENEVAYFPVSVRKCFQNMQEDLRTWLHDFVLYSEDEDSLVNYLELFLFTCYELSFSMSTKICQFFKNIRWCGRIIDTDGYKLDRQNSQAIQNMEFPNTADELSQFVHACRWMSSCIPSFGKRMQFLSNMLEEATKLVGKRKKAGM